MSNVDLVKVVEDAYNAKALATLGPDVTKVATSFGYTPADILTIPNEANLGLGCGNPVAAASLKAGEIVLDLGSGAGIDVFLAAGKVGETGKVIGIDGSSEMIARARRAARDHKVKPPYVSFIQSQLTEPLPIVEGSIDCVLSNCVINLLPSDGKRALMGEVWRVLKGGGRAVLDDVITKGPLEAEVKENLTAYVNCISGALQLEEYKALLRDAGFIDSTFIETKNDMSACYNCCPPIKPTSSEALVGAKLDFDVNKLVSSYQILVTKPVAANQEEKDVSPLLRWWDAYPVVKSTPALMAPEELAALVKGEGEEGTDFMAIDVRRDDYVDGYVRGSANWPAQTFYDDLPAFLDKYKNTKKVVFFCGSSSGRGPRCAGWYQDYLNETGTTTSTAYVLQGGIKAWLAKYGGPGEEGLIVRD